VSRHVLKAHSFGAVRTRRVISVTARAMDMLTKTDACMTTRNVARNVPRNVSRNVPQNVSRNLSRNLSPERACCSARRAIATLSPERAAERVPEPVPGTCRGTCPRERPRFESASPSRAKVPDTKIGQVPRRKIRPFARQFPRQFPRTKIGQVPRQAP